MIYCKSLYVVSMTVGYSQVNQRACDQVDLHAAGVWKALSSTEHVSKAVRED